MGKSFNFDIRMKYKKNSGFISFLNSDKFKSFLQTYYSLRKNRIKNKLFIEKEKSNINTISP